MKFFYALVLVIASFYSAQERPFAKTIDSLLDHSKQQFAAVDILKSIETANKALKMSQIKNYSKGITIANIYIGKAIMETGNFKKALEYIEQAEKEPYFNSYINAQVEVYRLRGIISGNLKMYNVAIRQFYKQLKLSEKIEDPYKKALSMFWAHENLTHVFSILKLKDSVWIHLKTQENILKGLNEKSVALDLSTTYSKMGEMYITEKKYSQAKIYLDKSMDLLTKYKIPYLYNVFLQYGNYEASLSNEKEAVNYYRRALNNTKEIGDIDGEKLMYGTLGEYLVKNKIATNEANEYLYQYRKLSDSLDSVNKKSIDLIFNNILSEEEKKYEKEKVTIVLVVSIPLIMILGLFIFYYFKKKKESTLNTQILSKKLDENKFGDLLVLAKQNSPEFIVLFNELYPNLFTSLKKIDPNVRNSELSFCAMGYLNFSTKDIATYTSVTIRAVEVRKNRLRKKYNISPAIDFNNWMRNLDR
ncbi:tetratricopeptide repeat protein [Elizabethkingia anophelis]|uniref:tetratricopeptide repeat protein n=1 Tax=Elizabethkingia anophelis TaxID=1117645 RepID=UPI0038915BA7